MKPLLQVASAVMIALLIAPMPAHAQLPTAAIRGVATDSQGAVLPGATVTVTSKETGLVRSTATNAVGVYRIAGLPSGTYEVVTELNGFQRTVRTVQLELNQEAELNVSLGVAGTTEVVEVMATTPIIETTRSEVSRTFGGDQVRDLPLAGRNYLNLAFLVPGVTGGASNTGLQQGFGGSVNGQRARNVNFVIDGSDNNDASVTGTRTPVMQDAIAEFRLVTTGFSAEFGRNTGAIAVASTRSGTNAFHGTAYEFYENAEKLNARTRLEKVANRDKPGKLRRDTYGFTVGGPIQRERLFFFGGYQRRPFEGAPAQVPITSPTQEGRALLATVPGADPQMLQLLNRYVPAGDSGNTSTQLVNGVAIPMRSFIASVPTEESNNQTVLRIDHNLSNADLIYGRYIWSKLETVGNSNPPGFAFDSVFPTHNFVTTWNRIVSSAMLNELHFSFGRTGGLFPGSRNNPDGNNDLPTINVGPGASFFRIGLLTNIPQDRVEKVWQITDNISYLRGNHSVKVGADVRYVDLVPLVPFDFRGTYEFQTLQQFVTNTPFSTLRAHGNPTLPFRYWETFFFAQDDWKWRPNLTLNLGLRYERVGAAEKFYSNYQGDNNNFAPRLGFAWDLAGEGKTVVRGGAGMAYDQFFLNLPLLAGQAPPFQRRITDQTGAFRYPNLPGDRDITPNEVLALNRLDIPDNDRYPYSIQWQLGVQRQFGTNWRAEAAYVGSRGLKLIRLRIENPVVCCPRQTIIGPTGVPSLLRHGNPRQTGQINLLETSASSKFHSGQFSVERRLSSGFSLSVAYTLSRFMDDATESLGTGVPSIQRPQDNFNLDAEWARSSLDRPHNVVVSWIYELPFWRDQQGALGRVLGGWQINGSYIAQSGQPFSIFTGVDSNGDGDATNDRPNQPNGDPKLVASYTPRPALSGGNGNLERNSERGPGVNTWNAAFFKNIRLVSDHKMQFRVEVFNLLNHRQYSLTGTGAERNLSNAGRFYDFTQSTGGNRETNGPTLNARTMILGVKYLF